MHIKEATNTLETLGATHTHTHTHNREKCLNRITHKTSYKEQYKHIQRKHEKCLNIIMHKTSYKHFVALDKHKNCENRKSKNQLINQNENCNVEAQNRCFKKKDLKDVLRQNKAKK